MEEDLAAVVLVDIDGLAAKEGGVGAVEGEGNRVGEDAAQHEASGRGCEDEVGGDEGAGERCLPGGFATEIEGGELLADGATVAAKAMNSLGLMKRGRGRQVESKRASWVSLPPWARKSKAQRWCP